MFDTTQLILRDPLLTDYASRGGYVSKAARLSPDLASGVFMDWIRDPLAQFIGSFDLGISDAADSIEDFCSYI